jgi:hypothetical protein
VLADRRIPSPHLFDDFLLVERPIRVVDEDLYDSIEVLSDETAVDAVSPSNLTAPTGPSPPSPEVIESLLDERKPDPTMAGKPRSAPCHGQGGPRGDAAAAASLFDELVGGGLAGSGPGAVIGAPLGAVAGTRSAAGLYGQFD